MAKVSIPKAPKNENTIAFRLIAFFLAPILRLFFNIKTEGRENLPSGGYVLVGNHLSYLDPLAFAYSVYIHMKRVPHYLAKEALFRVPVLKQVLPKVGQIPVYRTGNSNEDALRAAKDFLRAGQVVVVFPEGTLTRDPDLWPMRGKHGAVRMAAELGLPIVPAAHWGVHKVMGNYDKKFRPNPFHTVRVKIGKPMDFSKLGASPSASQLNEATEKVMNAIAELVGEMRSETPPKVRWDPTAHSQDEIGNFRKRK
ncbi:MAG: lysophospholipid acyltransferase family protein [Aquiluna sp.]